MNISRLNGWTVRYIMWGISYRTLTSVLDTVKAPTATKDGSSYSGEEINFNEGTRPESINKLAALGITIKDFT